MGRGDRVTTPVSYCHWESRLGLLLLDKEYRLVNSGHTSSSIPLALKQTLFLIQKLQNKLISSNCAVIQPDTLCEHSTEGSVSREAGRSLRVAFHLQES